MAAGSSTFRATAPVSDLDSWMREHRFGVTESAAVRISVLDTFDGRLARAGVRLVAVEGAAGDGSGEVLATLGGDRAVAVTVTCSALPRTAADFPIGPLRTRVAGLLGIRVLLPRLSLDTRRAVAVRRNDDGKVDVAVTLLEPAPDTGDSAPVTYVTVTSLAGYESEASGIVDALGTHLDVEPITGAAEDVIAAAQGVDLRAGAVEPGIPLDPSMPAIDGVRAVLANLRDAVVANRPGAVAALDPEFLHELRVAVRRARAVLRHAKSVLPHDVYEAARLDLAWLGEITGPVRDLDVYQIEWPTYVDGLDDAVVRSLERVRVALADRRTEAQRELASELGGDRADEILARWSESLDGARPDPSADDGTAEKTAEKAARPLARFVSKRIKRAHARMIERGRAIDAATPDETIHELRKDAKKLRYLIECFGGLYDPAERKPFVKRLKKLQDNLGEHQDAAVHAVQLRAVVGELATSLPVDTVLAAGQLVERMEQRRGATRDEFAERFAAFDSKHTRQALHALLASAARREGPP